MIPFHRPLKFHSPNTHQFTSHNPQPTTNVTIIAESNVATIEVPRTLYPPTPVVKGHDIEEKSQELVVTAEKDLGETPPSDLPSNFQLTPQFSPFTRFSPSPPPQVDAVFVNRFPGSRLCDYFILLTPDLLHPSHSKNFISQNSVSSSAKTLELVVTIFAFETENMPKKMIRDTILVFDPGGISPCYEFSSATAPPPQCSTFVFDPGGYRHCLSLIVPLLICVTVCRTHLQKLLSIALPLAQRIGFHNKQSITRSLLLGPVHVDFHSLWAQPIYSYGDANT